MARHSTPDLTNWWERPSFAALIVVAMSIPLLWPTIPPLVDLPGHMGRYKIQLDLETSPFLQQFYTFEWSLIGNLGVDLLIMVLGPIFGVELGVKIIVIAIPTLSAIGAIWISREVHGRVTPTVFLALPFIYGHPFQFGFVNFTLAMGLALNGFALWLRLGRQQRYRLRAMVFLAFGPVIWVAHSFAWGVLGLLCFSGEVYQQRDNGRRWHEAVFVAGLQCLSLAPPLLLMLFWRTNGVSGPTLDWFNWKAKSVWLLMTLRDRWPLFDWASLGLAVICAAIFAVSKSFQISRNLALSVAILTVAFVMLPRMVFGSAYADMRLLNYVFLFAILAIRPTGVADRRDLRAAALVGLLFFAGRLGGHTISYAKFDAMHTQTLTALNHVPRGARLVTFVGRAAKEPWYTDRQEHIPALAIVRREAFSNDQWVAEGAQLLRTIKTDAPGFVSDPSQLVKSNTERAERWRTNEAALRDFPRYAFDYVWMITPKPFDPAVLKGLTVVWRDDRDTLYRVDRPKSAGGLQDRQQRNPER